MSDYTEPTDDEHEALAAAEAEKRWPIHPGGVTDVRDVPDLHRYRSCFVMGATWSAGFRRQGPITATHSMLPGTHERPGGVECRCGMPWDFWNERCLSTTTPAPDPAVTAAHSILRDALATEVRTDHLYEAVHRLVAGITDAIAALEAARDAS